MAENTNESVKSDVMNVNVKTPKDKHTVEVKIGGLVKELKEKSSAKFNAPVEQLCMIFAGKILKDDDTLEQHGIKDGLTVHLVIKSPNRTVQETPPPPPSNASTTPQPNPNSAPDVSQTPFNLGGIGGLGGLSGLGMGSANFMEMQQRMQREMMSNPDMMRQLMDSPFVQSMMSNPEIMRTLLMNNPQMRELMDRNPEITHMLNNPEVMRQTMELARNPAMMQELMRSQDRALSNLESIPGGFNALQRMYRDVQEPMMNAAQGANPFASLVNNSGSGTGITSDQQQGRENSDPLPNPWGPAPSTNTTTNSQSGTTTSTPSESSSGSAGMFNTPGMQSLMQQMMQNPQMMNNMLQAPYMQNMLQGLSNNPELAQQIIGENPLFANNPQMQANMSSMMPTLLQQMQNPDMQNMMTNPRAMEALMRIQSGLSQLQQESPGMFSTYSGMNPNSTQTTTSVGSTSTPSTTTTTASSNNSTTTTPGVTSAGGPLGQGQQSNPEAFSTMMSQMMQMMVSGQQAGGQQNQMPEQRYAAQLDILASMGFVDREANIRALTATFGDVNAAIDRLLQQR